jgi:hypothetical protein
MIGGRFGKRWQGDRGLKHLSNFYQRLFEEAVPLKDQGRRKAILLPFAKRSANGRIHFQEPNERLFHVSWSNSTFLTTSQHTRRQCAWVMGNNELGKIALLLSHAKA